MRRLGRRRLRLGCLAVSLVLLELGPVARAADLTDVATAFDTDRRYEFRLGLDYDYTVHSAAIKREHEAAGQDAIAIVKDLYSVEQRHTMTLHGDIALYRGLMLSIGLPMVLGYDQNIGYDQRLGSSCVYSGSGANCVNAANSTTTNADAPTGTPSSQLGHYTIVPAGGYDAQNGGAALSDPTQVFRGPHRGGNGNDVLESLDLSLTYAIFNQRHDDTKPTWTATVGYQISIGNIMSFDRTRPDANHGVADGLDHFILRTAASRRLGYIEPYAEFWFDYPIVRRDDTLFVDLGPRAKSSDPQISAGALFGLEVVPWERKAAPGRAPYKVAIDLGGRVAARFEGRGYSEAWQIFAGSPALSCDPSWNPSCSATSTDPTTGKAWGGTTPYQNQPYSGLTTIQDYLSFGLQIAANAQITRYLHVRTLFAWQHSQSHFITMDDVGLPDAGDARITKPNEFNPAYRPIINAIGRRYLVDDLDTYTFGLQAEARF